jgi:hypothetical protein
MSEPETTIRLGGGSLAAARFGSGALVAARLGGGSCLARLKLSSTEKATRPGWRAAIAWGSTGERDAPEGAT